MLRNLLVRLYVIRSSALGFALVSSAALVLAGCRVGDSTYTWVPLKNLKTTEESSSSSGKSPSYREQRKFAEGPKYNVTIIDEFANDEVAAIGKYQNFHPVLLPVADLNVSGDTVVIGYLGQPTARSEWAKRGKVSSWNQWHQMTVRTSYWTVKCFMPLSEFNKFSNLERGSTVELQAKLIAFKASTISLSCRK